MVTRIYKSGSQIWGPQKNWRPKTSKFEANFRQIPNLIAIFGMKQDTVERKKALNWLKTVISAAHAHSLWWTLVHKRRKIGVGPGALEEWRKTIKENYFCRYNRNIPIGNKSAWKMAKKRSHLLEKKIDFFLQSLSTGLRLSQHVVDSVQFFLITCSFLFHCFHIIVQPYRHLLRTPACSVRASTKGAIIRA